MEKTVKDVLKNVGMTEEKREGLSNLRLRGILRISDNPTNKEIRSYLEDEYQTTPTPETIYKSIVDITLIFSQKIIKKIEKMSSKSDREDKLLKLLDYYNKRFNKIFKSNEQFDIPQDIFIFMVVRECLLNSELWGLHQLIYSKFKTKIKIFESHQEK